MLLKSHFAIWCEYTFAVLSTIVLLKCHYANWCEATYICCSLLSKSKHTGKALLCQIMWNHLICCTGSISTSDRRRVIVWGLNKLECRLGNRLGLSKKNFLKDRLCSKNSFTAIFITVWKLQVIKILSQGSQGLVH